MLSCRAVELLTAVCLTGVLLQVAAAPAAPATEAVALARRVEERHRTLVDLTARFTQSYRSGMLGREIREKGTVSLKPPGRMLWEYRDPEKKTFVSDGRRFYFYVPADRQVIVRDQADARGIPARLLAGTAKIGTDFDITEEAGRNGLRRLVLVPRVADPEVERVLLDVDSAARIRGIVVVDLQGSRSQFEFEDVRENVGLRDGIFRFQVPRGVEVVSG